MGSFKNLRAFVGGSGVDIKRVFVAGGAANADLAVAGLTQRAELLSVVEWAAGVPTDRTAVASIKAGGGVVHVNDDTTGNTVEVLYAQP